MTRHPVVIALMVLVGLILLLPGICAIVFIGAGGVGGGSGDPTLISLWAVCLLISAGGVWLIVKAFR
jgi:hypothetical protein